MYFAPNAVVLNTNDDPTLDKVSGEYDPFA